MTLHWVCICLFFLCLFVFVCFCLFISRRFNCADVRGNFYEERCGGSSRYIIVFVQSMYWLTLFSHRLVWWETTWEPSYRRAYIFEDHYFVYNVSFSFLFLKRALVVSFSMSQVFIHTPTQSKRTKNLCWELCILRERTSSAYFYFHAPFPFFFISHHLINFSF